GAMAGAAVLLLQAPASEPTPHVDALAHKGYSESIPGSDMKFDMAPIPGGTFLMGSPADEKGRSDDEGPQHPVQIRPFWMGKCEVTWDEYDLFWNTTQQEGSKEEVKAKPTAADAVSKPTPPYADPTFSHGHEKHAALCITQHAAMEYCRWLSLK